jgi:hypothetical protein
MKYKMVLFFLWGIFSCNGPKNIGKTLDNQLNSMDNEYYHLKAGENLFDFVDKSIVFDAIIAQIPAQHMMKASLNEGEKEKHEYLDPDAKYKGGQIVGYYLPSKVEWPKEKKATIKVYGSLRVMSGKGKGGGTHTEYYLDIDKVELAE